MTIRVPPRSPGSSELRNDAKRGPRSMAMAAAPSSRMLGDRVGRRRAPAASHRARPPRSGAAAGCLPGRRCAASAGATSNVKRASAPSGSIRPATRGMRMSPTMISRDGLRSSIGVPATGASARDTKSTGTNHARAFARRRGRQRDQPSGDRRDLLVGREHDRLPADGDRQPAGDRCLPASLKPKSRARSSTANISWPLIVRAGSGRRPSRDSTV